jgi:hypothetical protein
MGDLSAPLVHRSKILGMQIPIVHIAGQYERGRQAGRLTCQTHAVEDSAVRGVEFRESQSVVFEV